MLADKIGSRPRRTVTQCTSALDVTNLCRVGSSLIGVIQCAGRIGLVAHCGGVPRMKGLFIGSGICAAVAHAALTWAPVAKAPILPPHPQSSTAAVQQPSPAVSDP